MMAAKDKRALADIDRLETWYKFKKSLCADCRASCCTMPTEVRVSDLIRMGVLEPFAVEEEPKHLAKRLKKAGLIDHFNFKEEKFTLARMANGDCLYLDTKTRRCTIYDKRSDTCRNHPHIGPRPGYCAYLPQG